MRGVMEANDGGNRSGGTQTRRTDRDTKEEGVGGWKREWGDGRGVGDGRDGRGNVNGENARMEGM